MPSQLVVAQVEVVVAVRVLVVLLGAGL